MKEQNSMNKKIGFIGCGNMGGAIISGLIGSQAIEANNVYVYDVNASAIDTYVSKYGVNQCTSNSDLVGSVDIVFFAIKPIYALGVFREVKTSIKPDALCISIVTGADIGVLEKELGEEKSIVKVMPNTPAAVNEGMSMLTFNQHVSEEDKAITKEIFDSIGKCEELDAHLIHSFTAACGSAPAYIFMLIEAMADAAVLEGMPRDKAYKLVAQTVYGSAKMVLETGKHPAELKDAVCSPGGVTIEGVKVLEDERFRASIINCMTAVAKKSKEMSK
jgi:pyrroline-5-carboxylate reductase